MKKTAFLFPGQGSQHVGMGKDIASAYPEAQVIFDQGDDILEEDFASLCFEGPDDRLNDTYNTQPALYISSIAILKALQSELTIMPDAVAGHSLGEFTALTVADAFTFDDGLRLVRQRARLMRDAGERYPGGMAAILGMDVSAVRDICQFATAEAGKPVVVANDNCPGQVVISGNSTALDIVVNNATTHGARRVIPLAVSIAAHSPLMQSASDEFTASVLETPMTTPDIPVFGNVNVNILRTVDDVRDELLQQLTQAVRWTEIIQAMIADGIERFVEIGAGDVLTGLVKRIDRKADRVAINSVASLKKFVADNQ